jgi:hypothetical protein
MYNFSIMRSRFACSQRSPLDMMTVSANDFLGGLHAISNKSREHGGQTPNVFLWVLALEHEYACRAYISAY